ncbi:sperm protamine P1 [Bactrocera tryoni]|uniref:sperm protamine P1 n=1 Tax=Bactrocera tryoni TaxID=59916 RepID=UPI001A9A0A9A|nr:sperm protamine P1 [Bactrocera tryoni]
MSSKIVYFLAALLAILCLLQQFESTAAANTQLRRAFSRDTLAARKQLQQNTHINRLNNNQYNNQNNEDETDDDNDDDAAVDGGFAVDEDDTANSALRNVNAENAAQAHEQTEVEATEGELANSGDGADDGGRARRRRRGRGRGRRRRGRGRGRRRGRRGGRKVRKSRRG